MTLSGKRVLFTRALGKLLVYAEESGIEVALTYCKRCKDCPVGRSNSCHKISLAADLDIYVNGAYYPGRVIEHHVLHDKWDQLGGSRRIAKDINHYSFEHNGMR